MCRLRSFDVVKPTVCLGQLRCWQVKGFVCFISCFLIVFYYYLMRTERKRGEVVHEGSGTGWRAERGIARVAC